MHATAPISVPISFLASALFAGLLAGRAPAQLAHRELPLLGPRLASGTVWDGARILAIGGAQLGSYPEYRDLWAWDGLDWTQVGTGSPLRARFSSWAADPVRGTVVGCEDQGGSGCLMFEYANGTWTSLQPDLGFCFATQQIVGYDPVAGSYIGYAADNGGTNSLWRFGPGGWTQLYSGTGGPGLGSGQVLADPSGAIIWIGTSWTTNAAVMWRFAGGSWAQLAVPPVTGSIAATQDPVTLGLIAVVDNAATGRLEQWDFAGGQWQLTAAGGPPSTAAFGISHNGRETVVFGGWRIINGSSRLVGETWTQSGGQWRLVRPTDPAQLSVIDAAYDEARGVAVVMGQVGLDAETWEWRDDQRTQYLQGGTVFLAHRLAYDGARGVVVRHDLATGQTFEWTGVGWTVVAQGPTLLEGDIEFDGARILAYGLSSATSPETWSFDGTTWTQQAPATVPPARNNPRMAYDPRRGRVVLVADNQAMLYEWDGTNWQAFAGTPWLVNRTGLHVAFHPRRGRIIVGGGEDEFFVGGIQTRIPQRAAHSWDGRGFTAIGDLSAGQTGPGDRLVARRDGDLMFSHPSGTNVTRTPVEVVGSARPASARAFAASACVGSAGTPTITPSSPWAVPWAGDRAALTVGPLAPGSVGAAWILGATNQSHLGTPLPLDLRPLGAAGCSLLVQIDDVVFAPARGGVALFAAQVPSSLVGASVYVQAACADPAANALGWTMSDGIEAVIGGR